MSGAQNNDFYVAGYCTTPLYKNPKCQMRGNPDEPPEKNYIIAPSNFNHRAWSCHDRNPKFGGISFSRGKNPFFFGEFSQQDVTYTVLATNEFNSARKRMSVLVKKGDPNWVVVFLGTGCQRPWVWLFKNHPRDVNKNPVRQWISRLVKLI